MHGVRIRLLDEQNAEILGWRTMESTPGRAVSVFSTLFPVVPDTECMQWLFFGYDHSPFSEIYAVDNSVLIKVISLFNVPSQSDSVAVYNGGVLTALSKLLSDDSMIIVGVTVGKGCAAAADDIENWDHECLKSWLYQHAECVFRCIDGGIWDCFIRDVTEYALIMMRIPTTVHATVEQLSWDQF